MYTAARRSRSPPSPPRSGEFEKSLAEKESVPEHVAERGQCGAGRNAQSCHRGRKASGRHDDVTGRCADGAFLEQCIDKSAGENKEDEEEELACMALSLVEEFSPAAWTANSRGHNPPSRGDEWWCALFARIAEFRAPPSLAIFLLDQNLDPIGFRQ